MGLFNWLLIGHLVGDYLFQTSWMQKKTSELFPLIVHSAVYTIVIGLLAQLAGGLSWLAIGMIFLTHLVLDQRKFIDFWSRKITGTADIAWLRIMLDQSWHILILGLATLI